MSKQALFDHLLGIMLRGYQREFELEFMESGLHANDHDEDGNTLLHYAALQNKLLAADFLLTREGARPDVVNCSGEDPFYLACCRGHEWIMTLLMVDPRFSFHSPTRSESVLHVACRLRDARTLESLLRIPYVNVNSQDWGGQTPLHVSAEKGEYHMCAMLAAHPSARFDIRDNRNMTPVEVAISRRNPEIVRLLLAHGPKDSVESLLDLTNHVLGPPDVPRNFETTSRALRVSKYVLAFYRDFQQAQWDFFVEERRRAADVFASVVCLCDDYLSATPAAGSSMEAHAGNQARRFYGIASQVPMELQERLALLASGRASETVLPSREREAAVRGILRTL